MVASWIASHRAALRRAGKGTRSANGGSVCARNSQTLWLKAPTGTKTALRDESRKSWAALTRAWEGVSWGREAELGDSSCPRTAGVVNEGSDGKRSRCFGWV